MSRRNIPLLAASLALAACDQQEQQLPFDLAGAEVTQTVSATGGTVSTAQGASVTFPAGAVAQATAVTLTPVAQPASTASGTPVGTASFRLAPEGTALQKPAEVTLKLGPAASAAEAWLASVVHTTPAGTQEIGAVDVDQSSGLLRAEITTLGTLTAVLPEPAAVVRATPLTPASTPAAVAAGPATATRALRGSCGEPGNRCRIGVQASSSLLEVTDGVAVVFPAIRGAIQIEGAGATGEITLSGTLKVKAGKVGDGEQVSITVQATPATVATQTASEVRLTNVRVIGSGSGMKESVSTDLRVQYSGSRAEVRIERSDVRVADRLHSVRITLPLVRQ
jgi:hypothetical protein